MFTSLLNKTSSPLGKSALRLDSLALFSISVLFSFTSITILADGDAHAKSQSEARQEAFLLEKQGRERFAQKDYPQAIQLWRQAYDTYQDNKLLFFIASTYGRIEGECEAESMAWDAYMSACKESVCPNKERGQQGQKKFKSRCYREVTISSNAPQASAYVGGETWGLLPLRKSLLIKQYQEVKIVSPGHLSQSITIDLSQQKAPNDIRVNLTSIPRETFFEKHQLKIALSAAVVSVSILSLGSLQLSNSYAISDEVKQRNYPSIFDSELEQSAARTQYEADKTRFKNAQFWGTTLITTGVIGLGVSAWMLLYKGPNAAIHERARQQGDTFAWSVEPVYTPYGMINGAKAWWRFEF